MPLIVSIDLGTTKITSLALDADRGTVLAQHTARNDADVTSPVDGSKGRSEWDAARIVELGFHCLRHVAGALGERREEVAGIGITGQQHGVLVVDGQSRPLTPLINWQDRRGHDPLAGTGRSFLEAARERLGDAAALRTGCRLQPGFSAVTLFWMKHNGLIPAGARACFIMDLFGGLLTGSRPVTEPSCAGSSGLFNVKTRSWDSLAIEALDLAAELFPEIREADQAIGGLSPSLTEATGFLAGTPIFAPIGDHQASFVGSVRHVRKDVLVNVGTGAQVAVYTKETEFAAPIELRPFPIRDNLLSNVGLAGGWSYQLLENFFRQTCRDVFDVTREAAVYENLNRLAATAPPGCDGLACDPHFSGSRADSKRRGSFVGLAPQNFTPAHFARAVLEGMARSLVEGYGMITAITARPHRRVVAAGNALRENAVLRESVQAAFGLPLCFTRNREEAAFGAALTAAVGAGIFPSLAEAARLISYE